PFFLRARLPPRPLLSFPTRRSSDLDHRARAAAGRPVAAVRLRPDARPLGSALPSAAVSPRLALQRGEPRRVPAGDRLRPTLLLEDRKSTRLNSSHVSISYAVFCLKK